MIRCYLQGSIGDALHAISCAAGYNIRWLMRAILRLGLRGSFALAFLAAVLSTIRLDRPVPRLRVTGMQHRARYLVTFAC